MLGDRMLDETGEEDVKGPLRRMLSDKYVHYRRVAEILAALTRYGFGRLGDLASRVKDLSQDADVRRDLAEERAAVRFRLLLESLGPTFIKLGQMLSTRPDLIADEYVEELGNLREEVAPEPFEDVREVVEAELGGRLEELFDSFDEEPVAAASIGQVHRARPKGSHRVVAVKVQRPGIRATIRADIEILKDLAGTLRRTFRSIERFDPEGVVEEFGRMIWREVDYTVEARNVQRLGENLASVEGMSVPRVHFEHTTRKVLTMDYVEGVSLAKLDEAGAPEVDRASLANTLGTAYIKQIFVDGFFHADPHQGNIIVTPEGGVCLVDFGAVGYLDDDTRDEVGSLYMGLVEGNVKRAARALVGICGASEGGVDMDRLEWDLRDLTDHMGLCRRGIKLPKGMNQRLVTIALKHALTIPSSLVLLERALLELEGVCVSLDPSFDIGDLTERNLPMLLRARLAPDRDPLQALETAKDYAELVRELPGRLDRVLSKVENDDITIKVDMSYFEALRRQVRRMALMVAVSLVALAVVVYLTWAGVAIEVPVVQIRVAVPVVIALWAVALVIIYRRA